MLQHTFIAVICYSFFLLAMPYSICQKRVGRLFISFYFVFGCEHFLISTAKRKYSPTHEIHRYAQCMVQMTKSSSFHSSQFLFFFFFDSTFQPVVTKWIFFPFLLSLSRQLYVRNMQREYLNVKIHKKNGTTKVKNIYMCIIFHSMQ